jgi:hypothetical protein
MSGPSSSDLITRRKFLITERNDPLPCCSPQPVYATDSSEGAFDLSSQYVDSLATVDLTFTTTNTVIVTAIANATAADPGGAGTVTLAVFYFNASVSPTEVELADVSAVVFDGENKTLFLTTTFTPPFAGIYTFTVRMKDSTGNGTCNNAFLYAQGT